jgi:hypothetical protein
VCIPRYPPHQLLLAALFAYVSAVGSCEMSTARWYHASQVSPISLDCVLLTLRCRAKFRPHHLIVTSSSMHHYVFDIDADNFNVDSRVVCNLLYPMAGLLVVFDTDSQSSTPPLERFHNGGHAEASPIPLHRRSHLIALPVSTQPIECPAPGHAATGGVNSSASSSYPTGDVSRVLLVRRCMGCR